MRVDVGDGQITFILLTHKTKMFSPPLPSLGWLRVDVCHSVVKYEETGSLHCVSGNIREGLREQSQHSTVG